MLRAQTSPSPSPTSGHQLLQQFARLPIVFERNTGQTDQQVKFLSRGAGYSLFLTPTETVLSVHGAPNQHAQRSTHAARQQARASAVVRMSLVGANRNPVIEGIAPQPGRTNRFIGNDPGQWQRDLVSYAKVKYREVYPGVDVVYYGNQDQLEYDFVIGAGRDPRQIGIDFKGISALRLDAHGNLLIRTPLGDITQHKPVVYQDIAGERQPVAGAYRLLADNRVGFSVGAYDTSRPLVIDPVLVYSSYLGGGGTDSGYGIAIDGAGNAYVTGETDSADFPGAARPGRVYNDVFVVKLNPACTAFLYRTYVGGNMPGTLGLGDGGYGIAVDAAGAAYVTGYTDSPDFPVINAIQGVAPYNVNTFVFKLSAAGNSLAYSTYLGGDRDDWGIGISVDSAGRAIVVGSTNSSNFPTASAYQSAWAGSGTDIFVSKINAAGSGFVFSTYFGHANEGTSPKGVAVDGAGNAYVAGTVQPLTGGGLSDAVAAKFSAAGALMYSKKFGGTGDDFGMGVAIDNAGNAYVAGFTDSSDLPVTASLQSHYHGGADVFVVKINPQGNGLAYATYVGGSGDEISRGIAVDSKGNAYVTGTSASPDFAPAPLCTITSNTFVTKLGVDGRLIYARCLDIGSGEAIAVAGNGATYLTGQMPGGYLNTVAPLQPASGGQMDAFVAKLLEPMSVSRGHDYNGDGIADIFWRNSASGANTIWKSAVASAQQPTSAVTDLAWAAVGVGDFNADGKSDVVWRNASTGADAIWQSGNSATRQSLTGVTDPNWHIVGVGDFNGDSKSDLLWRNAVSGADVIWLTANPATQQAVTPVAGSAWIVAGVGDVDADGYSDIIWRNTSTGAGTIWLAAKSATYRVMTTVADQAWKIAGVGDFDGDGKSDLVWHNAATGSNSIWKSADSATPLSMASMLDAAWSIASVGDFDGDGRSDVLWRNRSSGANVIWRGASSTRTQGVTGVTDQAWTIVP